MVLKAELKVQAKETISIPQEVKESCDKWGEEYGICSELLQALCWQESRCRADAKNGNCWGMCQINHKLFAKKMEEIGVTDLYDADQCIHLCADILFDYFEQGDEVYLVLMKYNCGASRGKQLFEQGIYTSYAKTVTANAQLLEQERDMNNGNNRFQRNVTTGVDSN